MESCRWTGGGASAGIVRGPAVLAPPWVIRGRPSTCLPGFLFCQAKSGASSCWSPTRSRVWSSGGSMLANRNFSLLVKSRGGGSTLAIVSHVDRPRVPFTFTPDVIYSGTPQRRLNQRRSVFCFATPTASISALGNWEDLRLVNAPSRHRTQVRRVVKLRAVPPSTECTQQSPVVVLRICLLLVTRCL